MADRQTTMTVPRWALQFIMDNACFQDKGPMPEGWRSEEMERAVDVIEKALEQAQNGSASWHIWSGEHRAWWRRDAEGRGAGYVTFLGGAGKWTRAEAEAMTRHCGPEKKIELVPDPYGPDALVEHDGQHFSFKRVQNG